MQWPGFSLPKRMDKRIQLISIGLILLVLIIASIGIATVTIERHRNTINICGETIARTQNDLYGSNLEVGDLFGTGKEFALLVKPLSTPSTDRAFEEVLSTICLASFTDGSWKETYSAEHILQYRDAEPMISFRDMNGDNTLELLVVQDSGYAGFNLSFFGFVLKDYSLLQIEDFEQLWNPSYNVETQLITTTFKSGPGVTNETYRWEDGLSIVKVSP